MNLISIEPTPSPNSMKLTVSETLPNGESLNFTTETQETAPELLRQLLAIEGVKGLYRVADFIALERYPKQEWEAILPKVRAVFGEDEASSKREASPKKKEGEAYGEIRVFIQMFRDIPMQAKLEVDGEEIRVGLPERFMEAIMKAQSVSENIILERRWVEQAPRYGELDEVQKDVAEELAAAYDQERIDQLVDQALHKDEPEMQSMSPFRKVTMADLEESDWKKRYAALDRMDPSLEDLPILNKALHDEKVAIRRLATVYLGMLESQEALPYLYEALHDKTVTVRRTAGDALSDLGFPEAIPEMIAALKDPSKIVRWRAAMFLYEVGDSSALEALKAAQEDSEFEVALQVKMAIERIEGGQQAKGSVWKQMTEARQAKNN
ncbi:hypothetical protein GCM10011391_25070 [Pullulanibacillus camelliae]|uniref:Scaffold protein Nfu/NifU N-terminal domain-containing protein n=1 Tax=Pullulanibacillus camelliae TaxID=1707096 RepID=A0A8J2YIE2_9BACL|nr:conserved virulence factor C family protein [Pullulanibacillus camelliae]GGE45227.1 hypothetical protein GCM10011391_25070 [Pullulanibacillus camelliae]